ncbi:phosphate ABC transporter permease subunit PstC [Methanocella arvoryzae]|uniref:Phosphate transport system permease protein n=1 Tax=Methanocella arvoryzae (strain DSM 22066 / NBRC 105507 / MRE50) TaxID=351160 RepID=Q0W1F6_METAR|nr:phosphate ABC transporter permease subunit PstC [Methanocella arvoryzae]CAJ37787.1 high-affinity phosphate ABC-type import system,permease component 2 [Methanocella arvoryzae MRE50]
MSRTTEKIIEAGLLVCALSSIVTIFLIIVFIVAQGLPVILSEGPANFVGGLKWSPEHNLYGILPMIIGTFAVTTLSLLIALPLGVGCAILISEVAPAGVRDVIRPAIETLAAIPSVVYGLFGLILLVPLIRDYLGGNGFSILAGGVVLAIMILPTIISVSEDALRAVPRELREGSLAMGATEWQVITGIVVPAALSGIVTGAVLAMGRSIGETMAVLMVCGNSTLIPTSVLDMVRPMTAAIALEWSYASGRHQDALFSIGIVLLIVIMILNLIIYSAKKKRLNAGRM